APLNADAVVLVAPHRTGAANAIAEILGQTVGVGPHLAHLTAHGQYIAMADGPPLLRPQAGPVERLALVQGDACPQPDVEQMPFARVVLGIDIPPQPLPGAHQGRHGEVLGAIDAGAIMRRRQAPLGFVFDPAVTRRLALLAPLPADAIALVVHSLDIRVFVQDPETVRVAIER